MYSRYRRKLSSSSARVSENPLCQTSPEYPEFSLQTIGESALDELHGFLNCHILVDRHEQMQVIRHDHEIVQ